MIPKLGVVLSGGVRSLRRLRLPGSFDIRGILSSSGLTVPELPSLSRFRLPSIGGFGPGKLPLPIPVAP